MVEGDIFHFKNGNFRSEGFWEGGLVAGYGIVI